MRKKHRSIDRRAKQRRNNRIEKEERGRRAEKKYGGRRGEDRRQEMDRNGAHACFSSFVSHGFVFMNGFALVAYEKSYYLRDRRFRSFSRSLARSFAPALPLCNRVSGNVLLRGYVSRDSRTIPVRMEDGCESIFLTILTRQPTRRRLFLKRANSGHR